NGRIVIANRQVQIDTGFSEEYLLNRDLLSFIHPEDAEGFSLNVIQQLKGHILEGLEFRVVCKHGDEKWLISKVAAAMYNGKPSILLNYMDITASKFAEEELRKRESFNFALFQHNPVPTIIVDVEGRVVKSNLAQRNSWNSLPEIGDRMYQDYGGNHEIDMRTELMECINSGQVKEFQEVKYGDDYFAVTISPFSRGAMIMSIDITERKNAEERLRESEEKYRFLTENINDLIAMTDSEGNYIYVNDAHKKLGGYESEELLGRNTLEFLHPEDADRMTIALLNTQNKDETFDIRYKCKDGSYKWIQTRGSLFVDDNGKLEKVIAVANDITERKQFEEILRESELRFRQISELSPF
ncbi:MAG: PAS domain S-box protein, partial [bacterium]|nr:PAS domain S-box protein [bacterium]